MYQYINKYIFTEKKNLNNIESIDSIDYSLLIYFNIFKINFIKIFLKICYKILNLLLLLFSFNPTLYKIIYNIYIYLLYLFITLIYNKYTIYFFNLIKFLLFFLLNIKKSINYIKIIKRISIKYKFTIKKKKITFFNIFLYFKTIYWIFFLNNIYKIHKNIFITNYNLKILYNLKNQYILSLKNQYTSIEKIIIKILSFNYLLNEFMIYKDYENNKTEYKENLIALYLAAGLVLYLIWKLLLLLYFIYNLNIYGITYEIINYYVNKNSFNIIKIFFNYIYLNIISIFLDFCKIFIYLFIVIKYIPYFLFEYFFQTFINIKIPIFLIYSEVYNFIFNYPFSILKIYLNYNLFFKFNTLYIILNFIIYLFYLYIILKILNYFENIKNNLMFLTFSTKIYIRFFLQKLKYILNKTLKFLKKQTFSEYIYIIILNKIKYLNYLYFNKNLIYNTKIIINFCKILQKYIYIVFLKFLKKTYYKFLNFIKLNNFINTLLYLNIFLTYILLIYLIKPLIIFYIFKNSNIDYIILNLIILKFIIIIKLKELKEYILKKKLKILIYYFCIFLILFHINYGLFILLIFIIFNYFLNISFNILLKPYLKKNANLQNFFILYNIYIYNNYFLIFINIILLTLQNFVNIILISIILNTFVINILFKLSLELKIYYNIIYTQNFLTIKSKIKKKNILKFKTILINRYIKYFYLSFFFILLIHIKFIFF